MNRLRSGFVSARGAAVALAAVCGLVAFANATAAFGAHALNPDFRPPAVPLVTSDPYLSVWSEADRLTDDVTRHWTHHEHSLASLIRVDGKTFRLMGREPSDVPALPQTRLQVLPTRTIYDFDNDHIHVTLTFMTPALPHDLDVLTRPLTYISWQIQSADRAEHAVSIYDSVSSQLAVNSPDQKVEWGRETISFPKGGKPVLFNGGKFRDYEMDDLTALRVGTVDQPVVARMGDDTRIDWGYAYLVASVVRSQSAIGAEKTLLGAFVDGGKLPAKDDSRMPRAVNDGQPTLAVVLDFGNVGADAKSRRVMVAYDEVYSIKWFGKKLRPYWRRNGATPADLFRQAQYDYPSLVERCEKFDSDLMADLEKVGGRRYAQIAALAYRQCLAATGIAADGNKQPLLFTKENTSNGDLATVDVIFPMDPMMLVFSPTLAKASLVPVLEYAASSHWKFPNAPHDLGTYPVAMGRDDGGEGMPVEESGNMLLLCDAIAQEEGKPDFVAPWWPQLTQWARYLEKYGSDPEQQLCTDDFMGHLAHNANLSVKAILALAAYGDLCRMRGETAEAERYAAMAKKFAEHWMRVASDGDHSRLAFDKPNTWSQKYNLVWDKILGLNVFPPRVARQEVAYYKSKLQPYGVPLDSRTKLTKTDWSLWSATLADNQADFEALVSPIYDYLGHTTARNPLVDSYLTNDIHSNGMHARPVVGGIFIKLLSDPVMRKKWSSGDLQKVGDWAPLPAPPRVKQIVPSGRQRAVSWRYTLAKPAAGWTDPKFDDSGWKEGTAGFGTRGTPAVVVRTVWSTDDIWLRREFTMPEGNFHNLAFEVFHDEDVEIYVNGIAAAQEGGFITSYEPMEIRRTAIAELRPGAKITLAVHCHQTKGGQGIDVGLVEVVNAAK